MKWKKLVSMLLVGGMAVGLLAGCGSSESESAGGTSAGAEASASEEEEISEDDITTIELYAMTVFGTDGLQEVEDAVNEISEKEIGVHVNINLTDSGSYPQQISLVFAGDEQMDLMLTNPLQGAAFSGLLSQNQLQPLNELLPEYAPDLYELMEDYLPGTTQNGNIYAVPVYRLMNSNCYMIMRKDILDDLGLTEKAENLSSWTEYQEIAQAVVDSGYDDGKVTTVLGSTATDGSVISVEYTMVGNENWADTYGFDSLGDGYQIIAADEETDQVYSYFQSEEFYNMCKLVDEMYEKGYVYKDAATSQEGGDTLMANDVAFSYVMNAEVGVEASKKSATGYDVVCPMINAEPLCTANVTKFTWAIPVTAKEPEAAAKFMNLMYTNEEICNLLVWGIEGRDYTLNEEGEAVKTEDAVYSSSDFLWGNQFLAYPAEGQGGDFRETSEASMRECEVSKYYGCSVETGDISNELTAVYNVIEQYAPSYESGSVSVPDTYEEYKNGEFSQALEAAGIQIILDTYQAQLDEFLAEQ